MVVLNITDMYDRIIDNKGTKGFEIRALILSDSKEELEALMKNYVFSEPTKLIVTIKEDG